MKKRNLSESQPPKDTIINGVSLYALETSFKELYHARVPKASFGLGTPLRQQWNKALNNLAKIAKVDEGLIPALELWYTWGVKTGPHHEKPIVLQRSINGIRVETLFLSMKSANWFYGQGPKEEIKSNFEFIDLIKKTLFRLTKSPKGLDMARALWNKLVPEGADTLPTFLAKARPAPPRDEPANTTQLRNTSPLTLEELEALRKQYQPEQNLTPGLLPTNRRSHH